MKWKRVLLLPGCEEIATDGRRLHDRHPQITVRGFRVASWILLCILQASAATALDARPAKIATAKPINARLGDVMVRVGFREDRENVPDTPACHLQNAPLKGAQVPVRHLKFSYLTTSDGLSQGYVTAILQDRRGFMCLPREMGSIATTVIPSSFTRTNPTIRCIREDGVGSLGLSTQKGISRFNLHKESFRNYDVSDGLQSNEFSDGCYQGRDGEMFFGGSNGLNAFFPENITDDPFVPPVAITSFKIFNKAVPCAESVLKKAIPYVDSLTLLQEQRVLF